MLLDFPWYYFPAIRCKSKSDVTYVLYYAWWKWTPGNRSKNVMRNNWQIHFKMNLKLVSGYMSKLNYTMYIHLSLWALENIQYLEEEQTVWIAAITVSIVQKEALEGRLVSNVTDRSSKKRCITITIIIDGNCNGIGLRYHWSIWLKKKETSQKRG